MKIKNKETNEIITIDSDIIETESFYLGLIRGTVSRTMFERDEWELVPSVPTRTYAVVTNGSETLTRTEGDGYYPWSSSNNSLYTDPDVEDLLIRGYWVVFQGENQ